MKYLPSPGAHPLAKKPEDSGYEIVDGVTLLRPQSLSIAWDKRANGKMGRGKNRAGFVVSSFASCRPNLFSWDSCDKSSYNLVLRFSSSASSAIPTLLRRRGSDSNDL